MRIIEKIVVGLLCFIFSIWHRYVSPLFGQRCRFEPSCSQYAIEALTIHGLAAGLVLSMKRIFRCNGMNPGGLDPVPSKREKKV